MAASKGLEITYSSERSVQDELDRESYTDATTVSFSYLAMFIYIAFALTKLPADVTWASTIVHSRAGLGAAGVHLDAADVLLLYCSCCGAAHSSNDRVCASFTLATNATYRNKLGERVITTEWHVVLWEIKNEEPSEGHRFELPARIVPEKVRKDC